MTEKEAMERKCKRDGTPMVPGIALQMQPVYVQERQGVIVYPIGFPRLVRCLKCPGCGYSITV